MVARFTVTEIARRASTTRGTVRAARAGAPIHPALCAAISRAAHELARARGPAAAQSPNHEAA